MQIREYWDDLKRKNYKHWRTDAALRGFTTITEDKDKLEKWAKQDSRCLEKDKESREKRRWRRKRPEGARERRGCSGSP